MLHPRLALLVRRFKIPPALVLVVIFDQMGVHLVPTAGGRTYAPTGKKDICIAGQDDKRQMTGKLTYMTMVCASMQDCCLLHAVHLGALAEREEHVLQAYLYPQPMARWAHSS